MGKKARAMKKQAETDRKRYELEKKEQEARLKFEQEKHEAEMEILRNSDEYKAAEAVRLQKEAEEKARQEEEWQQTKAEMKQTGNNIKKWIKSHPIPVIIIVAVLVALIVIGASGSDDSTSESEASSDTQITAEQELINQTGGESVVITAPDESAGFNGWIDVTYRLPELDTTLNSTWRTFGSQVNEDVAKALAGYNQLTKYSGYGLTVHFVLAVQDEYGNYSDNDWGHVAYNADTLDQINYDNVDSISYKSIADDYTINDGLYYYVQ